MTGLLHDLRYALRQLRRSPGFTAVVVLSLALGVGVNTAIFTAVNSLLLKPPSFPHPEQLIILEHAPSVMPSSQVASSKFLNWAPRLRSFQSLAAYGITGPGNIAGGAYPESVPVVQVTPGFFKTLSEPLFLGPGFGQDNSKAGLDDVIVISYDLWKRQFGGNPSAVGRTILLNGLRYSIAGVAAPGFSFPAGAQTWTLFSFSASPQDGALVYIDDTVIGRLANGVRLARARSEMNAFSASLINLRSLSRRRPPIELIPITGYEARGFRHNLLIISSIALLVLLISCVNMANLTSWRTGNRRRELAVRAALGGGGLRLLRLLATENVTLSFFAGVFGFLIAFWSTAIFSDVGRMLSLPNLTIRSDLRVFGFALTLAVSAGLASSFFPSIKFIWSRSLKSLNATGVLGTDHTGVRLNQSLVVFEIAVSLLLMFCAGLLIRSFAQMMRVSPGYQIEHIVTASILPVGPAYGKDEDAYPGFFRKLLNNLATKPGIESVAATGFVPLTDASGAHLHFSIDEHVEPSTSEQLDSLLTPVTPGYFSVMGIHIVEGRGFTSEDTKRSPHVIVVSQGFAARYWPHASALGKFISTLDGRWEIVGITANVRSLGLDQTKGTSQVYLPYLQSGIALTRVVVRSPLDQATILKTLQETVASIDPTIPVSQVRSMLDLLSDSIAQRRLILLLLCTMALVAVALGCVGIYGVTSSAVMRRTQEIGLRVVFGARHGDIRRMVFGSTLKLACIGIALGAVGAILGARILRSMLFGVTESDILTLTAAALLMVSVALMAAYLPARRAAKVDPMVALRYE